MFPLPDLDLAGGETRAFSAYHWPDKLFFRRPRRGELPLNEDHVGVVLFLEGHISSVTDGRSGPIRVDQECFRLRIHGGREEGEVEAVSRELQCLISGSLTDHGCARLKYHLRFCPDRIAIAARVLAESYERCSVADRPLRIEWMAATLRALEKEEARIAYVEGRLGAGDAVALVFTGEGRSGSSGASRV